MDKYNDKKDSWAAYQKLILAENARLSAEVDKFNKLAEESRREREELRQRLVVIETTMKLKQAMLGFFAGAVGAIITALIEWFKK